MLEVKKHEHPTFHCSFVPPDLHWTWKGALRNPSRNDHMTTRDQILDLGVISVTLLMMVTVGMEVEAHDFRAVARRKGVLLGALLPCCRCSDL